MATPGIARIRIWISRFLNTNGSMLNELSKMMVGMNMK